MQRARVQQVLLLLEMTSQEFSNKFAKLVRDARMLSVIKVIDSLDDNPPGIRDKLKLAYEDFMEHGGDSYYAGTYFKPAIEGMSDQDLDKLFDALSRSSSLPDRMDLGMHDLMFDEVVKRIGSLSVDEMKLAIDDEIDAEFKFTCSESYSAHDTIKTLMMWVNGGKKNANALKNAKVYWKRLIEVNKTDAAFNKVIEEMEAAIDKIEAYKGKTDDFSIEDATKELLGYLLQVPKNQLEDFQAWFEYQKVVKIDYSISHSSTSWPSWVLRSTTLGSRRRTVDAARRSIACSTRSRRSSLLRRSPSRRWLPAS